RAVEMFRRLDVDGDVVAARLGEGFQIGVARFDHQVTIEHLVGMWPKRCDERRPEGDVVHEMPVHHVEVNPIGAGRGDVAHLLAEFGKVGRQDRRRNSDRPGYSASASWGKLSKSRANSRWSLANSTGSAPAFQHCSACRKDRAPAAPPSIWPKAPPPAVMIR